MAKATTAKAPKKVKKAAKAVALKAKSKGGKKQSKAGNAADALWKLAEHPLVGELIAVGATAAVAAIAEQSIAREGMGKKMVPSNAAVKAAGTAAAAAIGQRLINEFTDVKKLSKKSSA
jgi:hypothetical protein